MPKKRQGTRTPTHYRNVPMDIVVAYANTLLREIKLHLGRVISFTREDLLQLKIAEFDQVATITRHRQLCIVVRYLIDRGELVERKFPDLCLPYNVDKYRFDDTSVAEEYDITIRRLVSTMPVSEPFVIMHVVSRWRTDPQLTHDTKRKAVRNAIGSLVREGLCRRLNQFQFTLTE
jgi:hypothetical protein